MNTIHADRKSLAQTLMAEFAERTGLSSAVRPKRYLWTDAFAVCNYLGLSSQSGDASFEKLAVKLIDQVHRVLGQHHSDDPRRGWISGLGDQEAAAKHPTAGGLRIGKPLRERRPEEPFDERLEWERDGQYFHYLTKWMHGLQRAGEITSDDRYLRWAVELAETAHRRFTYRPSPGSPLRMIWKMNTDLSRPLVASQGQHDPLDALITYQQLRCSCTAAGLEADALHTAVRDLVQTCAAERWLTADPLGLGGLLTDVYRAVQSQQRESMEPPWLLGRLCEAILPGLGHYARQNQLRQPADDRLGFRELGLSIGLRALQSLPNTAALASKTAADIDQILAFTPLADRIEAFWGEPANRQSSSWHEHRDINEVMLATSLAPRGYLGSIDAA